MQAITTKFLPATNTRGSRVKASAQAGSVTVEWDHALNSERNHHRAALALANRLGWLRDRDMHGGALPDGNGYAFVFVDTPIAKAGAA